MSTGAFVFFTLFTWMVSSGSWLRLDRCTELRQYGCCGETNGCASCTNIVMHDKLTCERSVASEKTFPQNRIKKECSLSPGVTLNHMLCDDCVHLLQRGKEAVEQNRPANACECKFQQFLLHLKSKTSCLLLTIERAHCSNIITIVLLDHWRTLHCICKMPSTLSASHCLKEAGRVKSGRLIAVYILSAVLLLGIYTTRIKTSATRVRSAQGRTSTVVMFSTMTLYCCSPSVTVHPPSVWSVVAVRISFVLFLSCGLGRTVHVLIACRAAHTVINLLCPIQQQCRALPVTVLFIWLAYSSPFPSKTRTNFFEDTLVEGGLGYWAWFGQIELLATMLCVFVSLCSLLQSILTKLNVVSVLLHVQLVSCLQNSRGPTQYVLVFNVNRAI